MKPFLTLLLVTSLLWVQAHDSIPYKMRTFKVSVYTVSGQKITGYLPSITDTSLVISNNQHYLSQFPPKELKTTNLNFNQLELVTVRRKGATGRGILIGSLTGIGTGMIIGLVSGDDHNDNSTFCFFCFTAEEKALMGGLAGGILGGLVGGIIGALAHKQFPIGGNKPAFDKMRLSILEKIGRVPLE